MLNQLAVFVENHPGKLKEVTSRVRGQNVEFYAFVCFDNPEFGIFRFICDEPEKMKRLLTSQGFVTKVGQVLAVTLTKELGGFDGLLGVLAEHDLNLNYTYPSFLRKNGLPVVIVNTDDLEKSEQVLRERGFHVIESMSECECE